MLIDSTADILLYGNAERAMAEIANNLSQGIAIKDMHPIRGTAIVTSSLPVDWTEIDSSCIDWPKDISTLQEAYGISPYEYIPEDQCSKQTTDEDQPQPLRILPQPLQNQVQYDKSKSYIRLPSFEKVKKDPVLYAHTSRVLHQESNPFNARVLVQKHGNRELWVNPPPLPLSTQEIDGVFGLFFQRRPHPSYGNAKIPAFDMIKTSVNIMRGCFGGCTF